MLDLVKGQLEHSIDLLSRAIDLTGLNALRLRAWAVRQKEDNAAILPRCMLELGARIR